MKTKFLTALLLLLVSACFYAFRIADDPFETLLKKLAVFNQENPQEKVHLHLDKPYYAIGDDIWFKAYIIDNTTNQPSTISSALYVELINENDSVKKQIKLPVLSGLTWGDFKLSDTLPEGNYRIRAYTQWMRNAGPDFFFDKTIKIGNAWANKVFTHTAFSFSRKNNDEQVNVVITFTDKQGKPYAAQQVAYEVQLKDKTVERGRAVTNAQGEAMLSFINTQKGSPVPGKITATLTLPNKQKVVKIIPVQATSGTVAVQFFPEGGSFIEGLPSKTGIKAINASGLGENITGTLVDNEGNELLNFAANNLGMGSFALTPLPGKTYTAKIKLKDGTVQDVPLPKALASGYVLSVNNIDSSKVFVKIFMSEALLNTGEIKLVVQHNNTILQVLKSQSAKQVTAISLAKKDLPSGILHLTLFSGADQPVCERLVFINNPADQINLSLQNLKQTYGKRENMPLELAARDGDKPTQGSFSVAVTNSSIVSPDPDNESNLLTSMLLTSDLKGYIEKPNSYFKNNDKQARQNLDDLMLTQGWSRLLWKDIMANAVKAPIFAAEKSLRVSGTVTTTGGKPVPKGRVSLFSTSGGVFMIDTLTDDKGHFTFDHLSFGDSTKFVVQARNAKNKKYVEINLDIIPGQVVTKNKNSGDIEVNVNEAIQGYVRKSEDYFDEMTKRGLLQRTVILDQVNIVQKKNPAANSANLNGAGNANNVFTAKDFGTCINIVQCLQGRVAGLTFNNGIPYLTRNTGGGPMQIILDGMYVESDFLNNIQPADVETIEVLKSIEYTALYGSRGGGGVLLITTKRGGGDMSYSRYAPGIITYAPKGYYAIRKFYSPQYTPENTDTGVDNRTTVYWNPHIATDAAGNAKFNFYNTDEPGTYRVVIEGINDDGHLARKVYTYEVK
jgi:TonB-dependent SusC/RagA subfamily outer membrane receptor